MNRDSQDSKSMNKAIPENSKDADSTKIDDTKMDETIHDKQKQ